MGQWRQGYDLRRGGNDWIKGGDDDDSILGGDGDDTLGGNQGADNLYGNGGDDDIYGGDDNDSIRGGGGDDLLVGEGGTTDHIWHNTDDANPTAADGGQDDLWQDGVGQTGAGGESFMQASSEGAGVSPDKKNGVDE